MKLNRQTLGALMGLLVLVGACEDDGTGPVNLHVVPDTLYAIGDLAELEVQVGGGASSAPRWTSLDPEILSVSTHGVARALAAGTARVRVEVEGATAQNLITVLPNTDLRVTGGTLTMEPDGSERLTLHLRNDAGRGWFRLQMYRDGTGGGLPVLVSFDVQERAVEHGLDASHQVWFQPPAPGVPSVDFVLVHSRGAHELSARQTACFRLEGAGECPGA